MAEERILIRVIEPTCVHRELHETTAGGHSWIDCLCCNPSIINTNRKCDDKRLEKCKYKELEGLSRQEAIERMAKVFVNLYIEIEGTGVTYTAKEVAEAELNALLEVEK